MKDKESRPRRSAPSSEEREARSRLRQLLHAQEGVLRGTLSLRQVTCGKPNCKCARGERHTAHVLVASYEGRPRQLFVPAPLVPTVEAWVSHYQQVRDLLETLSQLHWDKVKQRVV